jgi:hypothetical protein
LHRDARGHFGTQAAFIGTDDFERDDVFHHVVLNGGLGINGDHLGLELVRGKSIHREHRALAHLDLADVHLVHVSLHLEAAQINDGDERRSVEPRSDRLAFLGGHRCNHAGDGRGDHGVGKLNFGVGQHRSGAVALGLPLLAALGVLRPQQLQRLPRGVELRLRHGQPFLSLLLGFPGGHVFLQHLALPVEILA